MAVSWRVCPTTTVMVSGVSFTVLSVVAMERPLVTCIRDERARLIEPADEAALVSRLAHEKRLVGVEVVVGDAGKIDLGHVAGKVIKLVWVSLRVG